MEWRRNGVEEQWRGEEKWSLSKRTGGSASALLRNGHLGSPEARELSSPEPQKPRSSEAQQLRRSASCMRTSGWNRDARH